MLPDLLGLDEFGQDLFTAIQAQAGSLQAFKRADLYKAKGLTVASDHAAQEGLACQHHLEAIFARNTLAPDEIRRILALH